MGLAEARVAGKAPLCLALLLSLLGPRPAGSLNATGAASSLDQVLNEPAVKLVEPGNTTESMEVEFGPCTVTCGIGIREVILTSGCPGGESKCIVRVEECKGPTDCGWGKPISESLATVKIPCIFVPPEDRFTYTWKMLIPDQQALILPNDSAILEVHRDTHPVAFQCDTFENEKLIASVKYTVYTTAELETRRLKKEGDNAVLVIVIIIGVVVCVVVILALFLITYNWQTIKIHWQTKIWKSREEVMNNSYASVRSSEDAGQMPAGESHSSQLGEANAEETANYPEWNPEEGEN